MSEQKQQGPDEYAKTMDAVTVVDEYGVRHNGLVTNGWGGDSRFPCINVVYVVANTKKTDTYGRQKEHLCSTSHASMTQAPGRYWYKDRAWAKPTERDAYDIQAEAQSLEKEQWDESNALQKEAQTMIDQSTDTSALLQTGAWKELQARRKAHDEKWERVWKGRR